MARFVLALAIISRTKIKCAASIFLNQPNSKEQPTVNIPMNSLRLLKPRLLVMLALAFIAGGCASWNGQVETVRIGLKEHIAKTTPIYVKDFDSSKAAVNGDYHDVPGMVAAQRRIVSSTITRWTICRLTQLGYIAQVYSNQIPGDALVVDGEIATLSAGSAASRLWVGIGSGHSTVRANVKLYRAANPTTLIADFQVAATSGPESENGNGTEVLYHTARDAGATVAEYLSEMDKESGHSPSRNY